MSARRRTNNCCDVLDAKGCTIAEWTARRRIGRSINSDALRLPPNPFKRSLSLRPRRRF
jgi:hypothetical protein